ncbi:glycosyltransferase family 2 protein [Vibrio cholerae]|nr:glycosyltransferase family 2 protein [Vibrio cholerae]
MPVYNVEKYVEVAVRSILNQTYKNLEIIIVDDFSNDGTFDLVTSLSKEDKRIKVFRNNSNLKIARTLNKAFNLSNGEYIARMDGDDISSPERIEKKIKYLSENKNVDLVGCSIITIDPDGNIIGKSKYDTLQFKILKKLRYLSPVSHIWVARRKVYKILGGYRELSGVEDYDFLLRMTSEGMLYTNLENDYDYYVRIGRAGNTISSIGIRQRLMHKYVYQLYLERKKIGKDSFSQEHFQKAIKTSLLSSLLFQFSSKMLFNAIKYKKSKFFLSVPIFVILSMVSPIQVEYLIGRLYLRFLNLMDA